MVGVVNGLMDKVSKDVMSVLPKKTKELQTTVPKQLAKTTSKIPSPEVIRERICGSGNMDVSKKMYNQLGGMIEKAQKILNKVKGSIEKLKSIVSKIKTILNTILDIASIISSLLDALKFAIPALEAVLISQVVPQINGKVLDVVINKKKDIKDKIKLLSSVVKGITKKVEFIIPKLTIIEAILNTLEALPSFPQEKLHESRNTMNQCMKGELVRVSPPVESLEDGVDGGVDAQNQTLSSLINRENKNQKNTIKIEEFGYEGFPRTSEYDVRTVPSDEF